MAARTRKDVTVIDGFETAASRTTATRTGVRFGRRVRRHSADRNAADQLPSTTGAAGFGVDSAPKPAAVAPRQAPATSGFGETAGAAGRLPPHRHHPSREPIARSKWSSSRCRRTPMKPGPADRRRSRPSKSSSPPMAQVRVHPRACAGSATGSTKWPAAPHNRFASTGDGQGRAGRFPRQPEHSFSD